MNSTHVFTRTSTVSATSALNQKAFLVLAPANDVTQVENYLTSLSGTDNFAEQTSRAVVKRMWATYEFHADGNPMFMRIYWLTPRNNPASSTAGAISSGASSLSSLLTGDDSDYKEGGSLATNYMNTLFDSPSVVRDYKIVKVTKWRSLTVRNNQNFTVKSKARYPKILDAGHDKLSTKWQYLPGAMIPVVEFKGFGGMDASYVQNPATTVPNTNNVLTAYNITEASNTGSFSRDSGGGTHYNIAPSNLIVRIIRGCDLTILSDEVREIQRVIDTTPTGSNPVYIAPRLEAYVASN